MNLKCYTVTTRQSRLVFYDRLYKNKPVKLLTVRWLTFRFYANILLNYCYITAKSRVKHVSVTKTNGHSNRLSQEVLYYNYYMYYIISIIRL